MRPDPDDEVPAKRPKLHTIDCGDLPAGNPATQINSIWPCEDVEASPLRQQRHHSWPSSSLVESFADPIDKNSARALVARARFKAVIDSVFTSLKEKHHKHILPWSDNDIADHALCETCLSLKLTRTDFIFTSSDSQEGIGSRLTENHAVRLGTLRNICSRALHCQLCRALIKALHGQLPSSGDDHVNESNNDGQDQGIEAICEIGWEIDGTTLSKQEANAEQPKSRPETMRLHVHWTDRHLEDYYLIMMGESEASSSTGFLGRRIQQTKEAKEQLIKQWLNLCKSSHGPDCHPCSGPEDHDRFRELRTGPYFGVIDVEEMCFKPLPKDAEYVTLSYYWGAQKTRQGRYKTTRKTVLGIKDRNGLSEHFDNLPQTIRDTIQLVRNIGLRYLWVDNVCLVTDLQDAWDRNATVMDLVYGQATLTVCAADGEDAEAGLWALAQEENSHEVQQWIAKYSRDLQLLARFPSETYVGKSKWSSRAWAFQERLFSKRCLIFCNGRMYFECCATTLSEDIDLESMTYGRSLDFEHSHKKDWKYTSGDIIKSYIESVALYTSMSLPKETEKLEAFEPIGKLIFKRLGGQLVYGLPNSHFDLALLWTTLDGNLRDSGNPKITFPSWSWCGWAGAVAYDSWTVADCLSDLHDWLINHTWITWYIRDGNGILRLVWDAKRHAPRDLAINERWRGYSAEKSSCVDYDLYGRKIPEKWRGHQRNEFKRALPDFPVQVRTLAPGESSSQLVGRAGDLPYLQFWSIYGLFYLELAPAAESDKEIVLETSKKLHDRQALRRYRILDAQREWVGETTVSSRWEFDISQPQPFVAISEAKWPAGRPTPDEASLLNPYREKGTRPWPFYNALLLEYKAEDEHASDSRHKVAYRVGLAKIFQEAFNNSVTNQHPGHKKWREIILG